MTPVQELAQQLHQAIIALEQSVVRLQEAARAQGAVVDEEWRAYREGLQAVSRWHTLIMRENPAASLDEAKLAQQLRETERAELREHLRAECARELRNDLFEEARALVFKTCEAHIQEAILALRPRRELLPAVAATERAIERMQRLVQAEGRLLLKTLQQEVKKELKTLKHRWVHHG